MTQAGLGISVETPPRGQISCPTCCAASPAAELLPFSLPCVLPSLLHLSSSLKYGFIFLQLRDLAPDLKSCISQTTVTSCLDLSFPSHLGTSLGSESSSFAPFAFLNLSLSYFPDFALLEIKFLLLFLLPSLTNYSRLLQGLCPPPVLCSHPQIPAVNPEEPLPAL